MNLLVEPHHDDILLSCEHLLNQEGYLLTCNQVDRRTSEKLKDRFPNITPIILPIKEVGYHEANSFDIKSLKVASSKSPFYEYRFLLHGLIEEVDSVILPAGIYHPHHLLVSKYFTMLCSDYKLFNSIRYYIDMPYFNEWKSLITNNNLYNEHYEAIEHYINSSKCSRFKTSNKKESMINIYGEFSLTGKESSIDTSIILDSGCELWQV